MKNNFLHKLFIGGSFLVSIGMQAQQDHFAYVVTDSVRTGTRWNFLRTLDLRSGTYSNILLPLLNNNELLANTSNVVPTNAVAAIALDSRNKRLYYTPLLTDKLSYIDLRTMRNYVVTNSFTGLMPKATDQSNIITRMVIADDDKGYALTNDGRHLIRFSTGGNHVHDLGTLIDDRSNGVMSVHNTCSSYGGDIVSDDEDNLYLVTSRNHVFKIDTRTRITKYLGTINGLPESFITSGVSVDKHGEKLVLVSSVDASDVYTIELRTLKAFGLRANNPWYASDLGNNNVLKTKRDHGYDKSELLTDNNESDDRIQLYPNPVVAKEFKIQFTVVKTGMYTIEVVDASGKSVLSKIVNVSGKGNIIPVSLPQGTSSGIYIVRITGNNDDKTGFSGKIIVQ
jgi:hypothetical protein